MAAYAATVVLIPDVRPFKLGNGIGMIKGTVAITNYNSTLVEITDITGRFRDTPIVIVGGATTTGYVLGWERATKAFQAWEAGADAAALDEVGNDTDVGVAEFVAFGLD
tara:strand:- start:692 stop:1018 length:327 start_codon:yes stop_codon:yes gene_type:complete